MINFTTRRRIDLQTVQQVAYNSQIILFAIHRLASLNGLCTLAWNNHVFQKVFEIFMQ